MKIAMLTTVGDRCGIAAYSRELVCALRTLPETEVQVVPITEGRQPTGHYVAQAAVLNDDSVDVIHIQHEHSFWGGIMPRSSAFWELRYLLKKPLVLTAHTTYSVQQLLRVDAERRPLKRIAKKLLIRNRAYVQSVDTAPFVTAVTIVHTAAARNELIERGAKPAYVIVAPTGVPEALAGNGSTFREKHGLRGKTIVTIFGYIAPSKGYELAIDALKSLPPEAMLVIAGGVRTADMEPYAATLRRRIEISGLADRVLITGYLDDQEVADAMEASDVVAAPHTQATGSYSVTLPIAHGRPIVASQMDCFREMKDRVNCIDLFATGSVGDLSDKLNAMLADPEKRAAYSANARKYASKYSWPKVAALTRTVYEGAIRVYSEGHHLRP